LFNHDPSLILGRTKAGTLALREDDVGLHIELEPADTSYARDLMESIKRGDIDQMSFAFRVIRDRWTYNEDDLDERELLEVALYDVAPVTYPFYEGTSIGIDKKQMDGLVKRARSGDDRARAELIALAERAREFCTTEPDVSHAPAPEPDEGHHPDAPDIGHSDGEKRRSAQACRRRTDALRRRLNNKGVRA
jgi:HK97 family phage prohead protease